MNIRRFALLGMLVALSGCSTPYRMPEAVVSRARLDVPFSHLLPRRLEVRMHRGLITVQPGRKLACEIEVNVRAATAAQAQAQADSVKLSLEESDDLCRLRVTHPEGAALDAVNLRYRLKVPSYMSLGIVSNSGEVTLRDYRGHADVSTSSARIYARLAGGTANLSSNTGAIRVEGTYRRARLETTSGFVEAVLPTAHATPVEVSVRTDEGPVQFDMADACRMELRFQTFGGSIALPGAFQAEWSKNGVTQPDRSQLYEGVVHSNAQVMLARVDVHTRIANVEIRRLADGSKMPNSR